MIYFLLPSYNDSRNFKAILENISKYMKNSTYKTIIIDDGSTDKTCTKIKTLSKIYSVSRIGYKKNIGPGYAFNFGFQYLIPKLKNDDVVITMEADNSTDFSILPKMIEQLKIFDIVLSSPFAKGGKLIGLSKNRLILTFVANYLDQSIFKIKNIKTYSSFYRAYSASILKKSLHIYGKDLIKEFGFSGVVELLIKLSKLNAKIIEVPAILHWENRKGKSKMVVTKTIKRRLLIYKNYLIGKYA